MGVCVQLRCVLTGIAISRQVSRGGDGSLFVLRRPDASEEQPLPMLEASAGDMKITEKRTYNAATDLLP